MSSKFGFLISGRIPQVIENGTLVVYNLPYFVSISFFAFSCPKNIFALSAKFTSFEDYVVIGNITPENPSFMVDVYAKTEIHVKIDEIPFLGAKLDKSTISDADKLRIVKCIDAINGTKSFNSLDLQVEMSYQNYTKSKDKRIRLMQFQQQMLCQRILDEIQVMSTCKSDKDELLNWAESKLKLLQEEIYNPLSIMTTECEILVEIDRSQILDDKLRSKTKQALLTYLNLIQDKALDKLQGTLTDLQISRRKILNKKIHDLEKSISKKN
jgi:hypothetical protein